MVISTTRDILFLRLEECFFTVLPFGSKVGQGRYSTEKNQKHLILIENHPTFTNISCGKCVFLHIICT